MVLWWWWALVGTVLLVCSGGVGVGWGDVAGPGPWSVRRALLAGVLAGPLTCLGLLGLVAVGGGSTLLSPWERRGAGVPAMRLSEAFLEASDVDALVRGVHPLGDSFVGGGQVGFLRGRPALLGHQLRRLGGGVPGRGVR